MKLIVDIPNSLYANLRIITHGSPASKRLLECMKEGIPLPKGHGRLKDADVLSKRLQELADDEWNQQVMASKGLEYAIEIIDNASTIIEASKEAKY